MKKTIIIAALVSLGAICSQAQGLVTIANTTVGTAKTNTVGNVSGNASGTGQYFFELLYSANTALASTANQIYGNTANFALWTDSGVTGANGTGASAGKINAPLSATATGWTSPGLTYDNLRSVLIVGWSIGYGNSWSAVQNAIQNGTLASGGFFGVTAVGTSFAGGGAGSLSAVNAWNANALAGATGISPQSIILNEVAAVPEPSTMALAALGGASLLLFRRRK